MNQIDLHKKIEDTLKAGSNSVSVNIIHDLISANEDAHRYFFFKADDRWLNWLWIYGFLNKIKEKGKDNTQYSYTMPELNYLAKVSEKESVLVSDIIYQVSISKENFNPEVIDRFLWICSSLPAEQIARLVSKIKNEEWIQLMYKFNRWGFDYEKMLEKLIKAKDYNSFLVLAEAVLAVRSKEEIAQTSNGFNSDNPFYFNDLGQTKIFEYLIAVDEKYIEQALELATNTIEKIILASNRVKDSTVFDVSEAFYLFDVDFFELDVRDTRHYSYRDDVKDLAATIKKLIERAIGDSRDNSKKIKNLYNKYINSLPFTQSMWRLRLFVLSLCPTVFKEELKKSFFKIFDNDQYHELVSGTEYYYALKKSFFALPDKRQYIDEVFNYFGKKHTDEELDVYYTRDGLRILACIYEELTLGDKAKAKNILGSEIDPKFKPEPSIIHNHIGSINPRAPITSEQFNKLSISEIVERFSSDWTPENLYKQNRQDIKRDFYNPLSAEGAANLLKRDIAIRFEKYLLNSDLFFNKEFLDSHYTYSFLQGLYDVFRQNKYKNSNNINNLLALFENIIASAQKEGFKEEKRERRAFDGWFASWDAVHNSMADIIKELMGENQNDLALDFKKYRDRLLAIISYLFTYPDPNLEDNIRENGNDPHGTAINSVRGKAFEAFTLFIYQDGKRFAKEAEIKIASDARKIYEETLEKENTYAVMFMYGRHLPFFYYRDKNWIISLLSKIFPEAPEKNDLYIAAWEGYISSDLYKEIFDKMGELYKRAIMLNPNQLTKRKYSIELDRGLANHIGLAFIYFEDFNFESDLFKLFWAIKNNERQKELISFIGNHAVSGNNEKDKIDIEKLQKFWDWVLENVKEKGVFTGFGFWMNNDKNIYTDLIWLAEHVYRTIEKSVGSIDWDYGLMKMLPLLASNAPKETLKILEAYLLNENQLEIGSSRSSIYVDREIFDSFKTLYANPETKSSTYDLINKLLPRGNGTFWILEDILK